MDVEQEIIMDNIMEAMHQITWWMKELAKKEVAGVEIPREKVLENKAINTLFANLQKEYRKLQEEIELSVEKMSEEYMGKNTIATKDAVLENVIQQLKAYVSSSYLSLRFVPYTYMGFNVKEPSIYKSDYEELSNLENELQKVNLDSIESRIQSARKPQNYSFMDKRRIIEYISLGEFQKDYALDKIEQCEQACKKELTNVLEVQKMTRLQNIIEHKYIRYYLYLNNKYNGFIQKDDIDKFAVVEEYMNNDQINILLNMTDYEINENKKRNKELYKSNLESNINRIMKNNETKSKSQRGNNRATPQIDDEER